MITMTFEEMRKVFKTKKVPLKERQAASRASFFNLNTYNPSDALHGETESNSSLVHDDRVA